MEAIFRTKNEDRKCDDPMWDVTVCGLFFGPENGLENLGAVEKRGQKI